VVVLVGKNYWCIFVDSRQRVFWCTYLKSTCNLTCEVWSAAKFNFMRLTLSLSKVLTFKSGEKSNYGVTLKSNQHLFEWPHLIISFTDSNEIKPWQNRDASQRKCVNAMQIWRKLQKRPFQYSRARARVPRTAILKPTCVALTGQAIENLLSLACKFKLDQRGIKASQALVSQPNGVASYREFSACDFVWPRL